MLDCLKRHLGSVPVMVCIVCTYCVPIYLLCNMCIIDPLCILMCCEGALTYIELIMLLVVEDNDMFRFCLRQWPI